MPEKPINSPYRWKTIELYRTAGWADVLPIISEGKLAKDPPPKGFTGHNARSPSEKDHADWLRRIEKFFVPVANLALHMPKNVIALDIDVYGAKAGGGALADLEEELGALPRTWRNSARGVDFSSGGHLFYRLEDSVAAAGLKWPGKLGVGIDIIQFGHRYAIVYPSMHPKVDKRYVWYKPSGEWAGKGVVPRVDELPLLPESWIEYATGFEERKDLLEIGMDSEEISGWLEERPNAHGEMCVVMEKALERICDGLIGGHPALNDGIWELLRLSHEGHSGILTALMELKEAWRIEVGG